MFKNKILEKGKKKDMGCVTPYLDYEFKSSQNVSINAAWTPFSFLSWQSPNNSLTEE